MDRDCRNCVRNRPDVGCTSWDCEYINRDEAIEAWKKVHEKGDKDERESVQI